MLLLDLMLTKDELLALAKKQYPGRTEIIRMLVLAEPSQTKAVYPGRDQSMDELIELSMSGDIKIYLCVKDSRIAGIINGSAAYYARE